MSGKQFFCVCCKQMGLDPSEFFKIGEQNTACSGGYVYHCPTRLRGPSHRYVVNYLSDLELYVAWNLDAPGSRKKTVFRILKRELVHLPEGEVRAILKSTHVPGSPKETVYAFGQTAVMPFLRMVCRNTME